MGSHYKIRTEKTGHYFTHGTLLPTTRYVWICLHGYGQLAKFFIQKFEFLDPARHFVIVPEGLNRFYLEGLNERPVASWMTREDRLDEIADYILFLEALRKKTGWDHDPQVKVVGLGFSQGVSTLMRWIHDQTPRVDHLLLWAGGMPDDILYQHRQTYFRNLDVHYFLGDTDPYIRKEQFEEKQSLLATYGINARLHMFAGDHRVDERVLETWVSNHLD